MSEPPHTAPRGEPLHRYIAGKLRQQIESGALTDGQALPSTRELAYQHGVSVYTITEATKLLAADGLLENWDRSKRIVRAPRPSAPASGEQWPVHLRAWLGAAARQAVSDYAYDQDIGEAILDSPVMAQILGLAQVPGAAEDPVLRYLGNMERMQPDDTLHGRIMQQRALRIAELRSQHQEKGSS